MPRIARAARTPTIREWPADHAEAEVEKAGEREHSDTDPREAPNSRLQRSTNALNVYAQPKPTKVTVNAAATTNQP